MSETVQEQDKRRISSPEELHDYIHVTGPGLWIMLTMIIVLLAALIIQASTYKMENTVDAQVVIYGPEKESESPMMICTVTDGRRSLMRIGMKIRVAGEEGTISELVESNEMVVATAELDREEANLPAGTYDAVVVLESTNPLSFLLKN